MSLVQEESCQEEDEDGGRRLDRVDISNPHSPKGPMARHTGRKFPHGQRDEVPEVAPLHLDLLILEAEGEEVDGEQLEEG